MPEQDSFFRKPGRFPTTRWSVVSIAKNRGASGHIAAVNQLIRNYWQPVFFYLRVRGYPTHAAEDLTQEFFTVFLERDWIQRADRDRGRFRTFLLKILQRFLSDRGPKRAPRQQLFEQGMIAVSGLLTGTERSFEPPAGESAESVFLRHWAQAMVERVRAAVRDELGECGCADWCDMFEAAKMSEAKKGVSQIALAAEHGLSRDQVRYRIDQVKERFIQAFQEELRCDGCPLEELDGEAEELMRLLARGAA